MAGHAPVEAITTGGQKATSMLQQRRSREKELDKLAARHVISGQKKPVSESVYLVTGSCGVRQRKIRGGEKSESQSFHHCSKCCHEFVVPCVSRIWADHVRNNPRHGHRPFRRCDAQRDHHCYERGRRLLA